MSMPGSLDPFGTLETTVLMILSSKLLKHGCKLDNTYIWFGCRKATMNCAGATSLPEDTAPFVAGGLALIFVVVALLATGGLGVGSIQLPGTT